MTRNFFKWFALIIGIYLLQSTIITQIGIAGVRPDLLLLILFFCAIKTDVIPAVFTGFFIGLTQDFYSPIILGQNALAKTIAGFFAGLFNEKVMRLDPVFQLLLIILMFILHDTVYFLVQMAKTEIAIKTLGIDLLVRTLPRTLYTLFFALIPIVRELLFPHTIRR